MRDIIDTLGRWLQEGTRFAVASVVRTWHSAPRRPGAAMAVSEHGEVVGSVSGGCVEAAVYELARETLASGVPVRETYGVSDADAFGVGLTCGGTLEVFVQAMDGEWTSQLAAVLEGIAQGRPVAMATVTAGPGMVGARLVVTPDAAHGTLGDLDLDRGAVNWTRDLLARGRTEAIRLGRHGERQSNELTVFVESFAPPARMLVFGANDFAAAVTRIGRFLGYQVTLCDARPVFARPDRFPDADEVVVAWPHRFLDETEPGIDERTVICVLTHDPKFDIPLLIRALRTRAGYIGAMGSRSTHLARLAALREAGLPESALARLSSPIGLDLGGRTPQETAVSIAAEIIALSCGGSKRRLTDCQALPLGPVPSKP